MIVVLWLLTNDIVLSLEKDAKFWLALAGRKMLGNGAIVSDLSPRHPVILS